MNQQLLSLTMQELRTQYPSMKRALFSAFHIGGCQSCAYGDEDTLATVCKNNDLNPNEVAKEILESAERDAQMTLSPQEVKELMGKEPSPLLLDCRTREEHEAVKIEDSELLTQELQTKLFAPENYERTIILYDHSGGNALDTCSWFQGHGLKGARVLAGGIDRWSQEIDSSLPRYRLELD